MDRLAWFNGLSDQEARRRLHECLAAPRWVEHVVSGRPYRTSNHLLTAAGVLMEELSDDEWLEAMRAHPRIGERGGEAPASSRREQATAMAGSRETLAALAAENGQYEERFGHVFLIYASGRGADEILSELRRRMKNEPRAELEEAKTQLRRIVELRLGRLLFDS